MDIRAALFACRHVRIKESSTLPLDESFTSTSLQSHIYWTLLHDPHSFSSRQLTRCTSTGRLGTSYLAQRQTKTQPTSASTTPPRVKPRFIWSHLLSSFLRRLSILHPPSSSPSCVLQSYVISCRFVQSPLLCMSSYDVPPSPLPSPKPPYRSSTIFQYAFSKLFLENLKTWPHRTSQAAPLVRTEPEHIFSILLVRNKK